LDELKDCKNIGLTAGASAPESKVQEIISNLSIFLDAEIEEKGGVKENIAFKLPPELRAS
jgi:4-hydroxy-3-methylbut-2-enyl diphosphate reductase